jgi:hypothetical protein
MPIDSDMLAHMVVQRHGIGLDVRGGISGADATGRYQLMVALRSGDVHIARRHGFQVG